MILSFSLPRMLPMIEAGIAKSMGEEIGDARIKGQTIRRRGPRAEQLLRHDPLGHSIPYDLDLWWKSRTPERRKLGTIPSWRVRVYPITIMHSSVRPPDAPEYTCYRIDGPKGWRVGDAMLFWSPGDRPGTAYAEETRNDGFDSPEDFNRFFVPEMGDIFEGILYRWLAPGGNGQ